MGTQVLSRRKEAGAWCWPFTSIQRHSHPPVRHYGVDKGNFTLFYLLLYRSTEYKHEATRRSAGSLHVSLSLNEKAFLQWYTAMTQFDDKEFLEKCYNPGKKSLKRSWQSLYYGSVLTATSSYARPAAPIMVHLMKVTEVKGSMKCNNST